MPTTSNFTGQRVIPLRKLSEAELDANNAPKAEPLCCTGACEQGRKCPLTYRAPRSLDQAFNTRAPIERPVPSMLREFVRIYRQYRKHHGHAYAARTAWNIAVLGASF